MCRHIAFLEVPVDRSSIDAQVLDISYRISKRIDEFAFSLSGSSGGRGSVIDNTEY